MFILKQWVIIDLYCSFSKSGTKTTQKARVNDHVIHKRYRLRASRSFADGGARMNEL